MGKRKIKARGYDSSGVVQIALMHYLFLGLLTSITALLILKEFLPLAALKIYTHIIMIVSLLIPEMMGMKNRKMVIVGIYLASVFVLWLTVAIGIFDAGISSVKGLGADTLIATGILAIITIYKNSTTNSVAKVTKR